MLIMRHAPMPQRKAAHGAAVANTGAEKEGAV